MSNANNFKDINVLHKIVVLAQTLLSDTVLPTNALFSAYKILQKRFRFNPAHDNRYARVLFKIGRLRGSKTLYEKFEEVLYRMGIEIEFDPTEDGQAFHNYETEASQYTTVNDNHSSLAQNRTRRNSESSLQYNGIGSKISHSRRNNSFSFIPRPKVEIEATNEIIRENPRFGQKNTNSNNFHFHDLINSQYTGPRLTTKPKKNLVRSNSGSNSFQIYKKFMPISRIQLIQESCPTSIDYNAASATTAPTSGCEEESASFSTSMQKSNNLGLDIRIDFEASKIYLRHLFLRMKLFLQFWKNQSLRLYHQRTHLELVAANQYKKTLLCAALHNWRIEGQEKSKVKDTELHYEYIFGRASRARDLYLLNAAFSHWHNFTVKRIRRAARARKHIIQTRIFNSWRDLTSVDELKVRHHYLKKYFSIWVRRYLSVNYASDDAIIKYEDNLVRKYYFCWLREFLASRASIWRNEKNKRLILLQWVCKYQNLDQQKCESVITHKHKIFLKAFRAWRFKTCLILEYHRRADKYYYNKLVKVTLSKWSKLAIIVPVMQKLQTNLVTRQIKNIIHIWLHRARAEERAATNDRSKILHKAWINWRHKTRAVLIRAQFDNRIKENILYKWIIHARLNLGTRLRSENLLRDTINIWTLKCHALRKHHCDQEALAQEILARKNLNCALLRWYSCMGNLQQCRSLADKFHQPRVLDSCVQRWKIKIIHLQQLDRWARDAKFYLSASRSLRKWKVSTELVKRHKRKTAYVQVKRTTKINLVRHVLHHWLTKTQRIIKMEYRAAEMSHYHSVIIGTNIFDRWRCYVEELLDMNSVWQEKILQKYFSFWLDQSKHFIALEMETFILFQERKITHALKKWSLRYLQVRARENYALGLREKNAKRNFRRIFAYWHQQAKNRRPTKHQTFSDLDLLGEIARNEAWSEIGDESEIHKARGASDHNLTPAALTIPTLIPGYLNTPSKRSERLTAAAARYSTTPKTPLPTLFERELRAMWLGGPSSIIRQKRMSKNKFDKKSSKNDLEDRLSNRVGSKSP